MITMVTVVNMFTMVNMITMVTMDTVVTMINMFTMVVNRHRLSLKIGKVWRWRPRLSKIRTLKRARLSLRGATIIMMMMALVIILLLVVIMMMALIIILLLILIIMIMALIIILLLLVTIMTMALIIVLLLMMTITMMALIIVLLLMVIIAGTAKGCQQLKQFFLLTAYDSRHSLTPNPLFLSLQSSYFIITTINNTSNNITGHQDRVNLTSIFRWQ